MKENLHLKQSNVTIIADKKTYLEAAKASVKNHRELLETYIKKNPFFEITLDPYLPTDDSPECVDRLINAGNSMGIGPMSAVAGTLASLALEAMIAEGANYGIVDNGGDIALINDRETVVGVYTGNSFFQDIGFLIPPNKEILGICTSSGTIGPSISFGFADAAIVFSNDVSLADSAATALGNNANESNIKESFKVLSNSDKILGAVLIIGDKMALYGEVPQIIKANVDFDCITKA